MRSPLANRGHGRRSGPSSLARAVIGGLLFATPTTLLVVPYLFAVLRKATTARRHTVYSRKRSMTNVETSYRHGDPSVEHTTERPPRRPDERHRWGGRLRALRGA